MSSSAASTAPQLNGNGNGLAAGTEAEFLEKLFALRDQVYAGAHPFIKLPPDVLAQVVAPRPAQQTAALGRPSANGTPNGSSLSQSLPPRPESSQQLQLPPSGYGSPSAGGQRPVSAKSTSSGIDPVLLTKSEHLIRAELQLKRQQIERSLKDQLDKHAHEKGFMEDHDLYVDCVGILEQAQAIVKPVSGLQQKPPQSAESTESFDENSYYSSNADSWSPERADHAQSANGTEALDTLTSQPQRSAVEAQLTVAKPKLAPAPIPRQPQPAIIDLDDDDEPYEPADDIEIYEPEPATAQDDEEEEEEDYSPPPAAIGHHNMPSNGNRGRTRGKIARQVAPHPRSPITNIKKRKREEKKREREQRWQQQQQQQRNKRVVRSPEPYIKEEPQSPPSFAPTPDLQPNKRRAVQPSSSDPEGSSGRERQPQNVYVQDQDQVVRRAHAAEEPLSPTVIRHPQRRVERDDQNLRRIASVHYARRPISPVRMEYAQPEPQRVRAASYAVLDRPAGPVYREESVRPSAPRYARESSVEYVSRPQSPVMMMPPPRRIVVDEYGNQYYATPAAEVRASVAPPSRRVEIEPYYERASTREPMMRPPTRQDPYGEGEFQRMAPPPPRRYVEVSDMEPIEARPYRQRELSHRPMEVEYAPQEVMERRPVIQYEEMGPPRDRLQARAYSVRPEVVRREVPTEYAPVRHESVQPGYVRVAATPRYRELSVHPDAAGLDERRYTYAAPAQGRRYVEEPVGERQMEAPEGYGSEAPRRVVSYRY
ncbi:hypothetical protein P154DRAFT_525474 [Amniculicola lignicola CBS 123094]|uniref:Uncharacterized protein n=1 Tax=Amniculicola lignicola CBS 123094 TaxID=1392246 RepID=A0A6A5WG68_9PLEO|nr:hypothetical protein P154DRAFT_525474 [Amniculicola lignicola CBS 123094]